MQLSYKELSTVLAALRNFQETTIKDDRFDFPHFDDVDPLTDDEIDDLCENLNIDDTESALLEEHKQWSKKFGEMLILALQDDFNLVLWAAKEMEIAFIDGKPVLYSEAIKKAGGE